MNANSLSGLVNGFGPVRFTPQPHLRAWSDPILLLLLPCNDVLFIRNYGLVFSYSLLAEKGSKFESLFIDGMAFF